MPLPKSKLPQWPVATRVDLNNWLALLHIPHHSGLIINRARERDRNTQRFEKAQGNILKLKSLVRSLDQGELEAVGGFSSSNHSCVFRSNERWKKYSTA